MDRGNKTVPPVTVWAMVMLTEEAREASVSEISGDLTRQLPASQLFFPAKTDNGSLAWDHAMAQYVFVGIAPDAPVARLRRSRFVSDLVLKPDRQSFELLTDVEMREVRRRAQPRALYRGRAVEIISGSYRGMFAVVKKVHRIENRADVLIRLHSKDIEISVTLQELKPR